MEPAAQPSPVGSPPATGSSPLRVVWLLVAATFVVFLNETTMSVALRPIMLDLHVDARTGQWLTAAFMLVLAVVIPITGFLLQRLGTRRVFLLAMGFFLAGTALALLAPGFAALLLGRVVQACGTALMLPLLMTTLMTVVPEQGRGAMMGNVSLVISVAPAVGPTLSGVLLEVVGWRGIFGVMLPVGLVMTAVGWRQVRDVSERSAARLDVVSVPLAAVGFGGLVYGLSQVGAAEGDSGSAASSGSGLPAAVPLLVGLATLAAFGWRQRVLQRQDAAMLDLRTLRYRQFRVALAILVGVMASLFGVVVVLPIFMQSAMHVAPLTVGLVLLPGGLLMGLLARPVGSWYDRHGPRRLVVPGALLTSGALWALSTMDQHRSVWFVLAVHLVLSVGLAFLFTPLFTSGLGAVPPPLYPHASALLGSLQQVAGAAGTALLVTIMTTGASARAGLGPDAALSYGVRWAFLVAAVLSLGVVLLAFRVRPLRGADHPPALPDPTPVPVAEDR